MTYFDRSAPASQRLYSAKSVLLVFALTSGVLALVAPHAALRAGFGAAAIAFGGVFLGSAILHKWRGRQHTKALDNLALLVEHDVAACLLTDHDGNILSCNRTAQKTLKASRGQTLRNIVGGHVATRRV